ncbi:hypothetical protein SORBI_3010G234200 [Sorghum bicolor]|uniref:Receptor-like serine/threonine-protein kinase n=1 Tax=Sorghum bicolor TaxID=4558 RepID=C5Z879_SORBI|nr:hypothetical protein SORBI_3010G234200 [Sorghum bicolor]
MASTTLLLVTAVAIIGSARCFAADTITPNSAISGGRTVVSRGGRFELGFFCPAAAGGHRHSSTNTASCHNYYVGIWYKKAVTPRTSVWVANRAAPVSDPASSQLAVAAGGNLVLTNEAGKLVWSSNVVISGSSNSLSGTVAVLLDSGNLVLRRHDGGEVLWQSIDHPTDTWLPGGRLGMNKITGDVQALTSWRSTSDPAPGMYSLGIDPKGASQFFLSWNMTVNFWSSGEWTDDSTFAGVPEMTSHYKYNFEFVNTSNASYFHYSLQDPTVISRFVGQVRQIMWLPSSDEWMIIWAEPHKLCDVYAICGAFGVCDDKSVPLCSCPAGFRPSSVEDWELGDYSHGCRRNNPLHCHNSSVRDDAFLLAPGISLQSSSSSSAAAGASASASSSAQNCRSACLRSCDCNAYSYGSRCALWYGDLLGLSAMDTTSSSTDDLYLRLSAMDVPSNGRNRTVVVFVSVASAASILSVIATVLLVKMFRRRQRSIRFMQAAAEGGSLVAFKYSDMRRATNNFSEKLGGGSFGSVYKGTLSRVGAAIAVKRLEGVLCVGEKQFRNEVRTIGSIQHVNLVRLRGFSSHGSERLLVYDHMPNGSLDRALFAPAPAPALSLCWRARFQIALGAARGLLYLHEGCRDCIIHCDIKPENILLDVNLVPKIADFAAGEGFQQGVLTTVRGTIGYLAPEWISGVPITAKADVYSYGMVLLEIISGRRNARGWPTTEQEGSSLSGYFPLVAATKVNEGEALVGLLDERLRGDADARELERACRVACWCVQDDEAHRPSMEQVVQALEGVVTLNVPPIPTSLQTGAFAGDAAFVSTPTSAYFDGL